MKLCLAVILLSLPVWAQQPQQQCTTRVVDACGNTCTRCGDSDIESCTLAYCMKSDPIPDAPSTPHSGGTICCEPIPQQEIVPQPSCVYHGNPCPQWLAKTIGPYPVPPSEESMIERIRYPHYYADGPRFFQFRKGPHDDPATNRQVLHSKAFWIQSGFMFAAEELAGTRTGAHSERIAAAGVMGFSYLGYRFFSPSFTLGETGAGMSWIREWARTK